MSDLQRLSVEEFNEKALRLFKAFYSRKLIARLTKDQLQRLFDIMTLTLRPCHIDMIHDGRGVVPLQRLTMERNRAAHMLEEIRHLIKERQENLTNRYWETLEIAEATIHTRPLKYTPYTSYTPY